MAMKRSSSRRTRTPVKISRASRQGGVRLRSELRQGSAVSRGLFVIAFLMFGAFAFILAFSRGTTAEAFFRFKNAPASLLQFSSSSVISRTQKSPPRALFPLPASHSRFRFAVPSSGGVLSASGALLDPEAVRRAVRAGKGKGALQLGKMLPHPTVSAGPIPRADNVTGVYLSPGSVKREKFFLDTLDSIKASGGSAVVFDVKGTYVYFATEAPMANEIGTAIPSYDLPIVIAAAKERNLYTIGRFIALKDKLFVDAVPGARIKNVKTGADLGLAWADPGKEATLTYNREILESLLRGGIDEVLFDYIRFSTAVRPQDTGLTGQEKADRLVTFLQMARDTRDTINPVARIGISTYAILGWDFDVNVEPLGQDFVKLAPYVDIIAPMAYPDTFAQNSYYIPGKSPRTRPYFLVWRTLKGYVDRLGPDQAQKLRPWLQAYNLDAKGIGDEIDGVYDNGLCGFTFWNANNNYGNTYAAMKAALARRPEKCK